jgi:hypothetical protein
MRQRILLVCVVLAAILPLATGHPWRAAVGSSSIIPGMALADIPLGTPIGEVLNRFGTPSVVRLIGANGLLGYGFDRYGITVYAHGDIVQAVATTNSVLGGVNGIGLGTSLDAVVHSMGDTYGHAVVEGYPGVVYGASGIAFGIDHGAVAAILVFRPTGALPAPPAGPGSPSVPVTSLGSTVPPSGPAAPGTPAAPRGAVPSAEPASAAEAGSATGAVAATGGTAAGVHAVLPNVQDLKGYTAQTNFLSLAGYLRYLVHGTSNVWIPDEENDRVLRQAQRTAIR